MKSLRTFLAVMEEGSVNRAAQRLGVAQPTISRQIQALEQEVGGQLFERGAWGVRPTDLGFKLREEMAPVLREYDRAWAEVTANAQGRHTQLRIGYLGLAAARFLNPALTRLRAEFPALKLWLFDQTPGEQLEALREGKLDVALIGQEGAAMADDFHQRKVAQLGVCVVMPAEHRLAGVEPLHLRDLKGEPFIGVASHVVPGRDEWIGQLCHKAGFRPRFISTSTDISETFARIVGDHALTLIPDYAEGAPPPAILFRRLADPFATWSFCVLRQRGRGSPAARRLVEIVASLGGEASAP